MRNLSPTELGAVAGGEAPGFRTVIRHEIPRFDEPPVGLQFEQSGTSSQAQNCDSATWSPPLPQPMRWLPPDGSGPQDY